MPGSRVSILVVGDPSKWLSTEFEKLRQDGLTTHVLSVADTTREKAIASLRVLGSAHAYQALVTLNSGSRPLRPFNREIFDPFLPNLRYVSKSGAGYDDGIFFDSLRQILRTFTLHFSVDVDYLTRHGAYFANGPISVSE
jgi:hypothetical protein